MFFTAESQVANLKVQCVIFDSLIHYFHVGKKLNILPSSPLIHLKFWPFCVFESDARLLRRRKRERAAI